MSKHTPGPWLTEGNFVYALNGEGKYAVNRFSASIQPGYTTDETRTKIAEMEANARLIAAAPDLLAALQALYSNGCLISFPGDSAEDVAINKAAIAAIGKAVAE